MDNAIPELSGNEAYHTLDIHIEAQEEALHPDESSAMRLVRGAPFVGDAEMEQLLKKGMNMRTKSFYRPAFSFSYQQLATTVRKEQEESSSSTYNAGCPMHPDVDFSKFLDNESLLDQDLVTWVTLGKWHIPKREDLPVVTTPGHTMNFIIKPFNYFPEDPSMDSSHNIRFEQTEEGQVEKTQDNRDSSKTCIAPSINDYVFSFSGVKEEEIGGQEIPDETSPQTITNETSPQTITDQKNTQNIKDEFYFD